MTERNHDALREALGAYALDAVDDPAETAEIERHLGTCDTCRMEVDRHRDVASKLAAADSPLPEGLWDRIQTGIGEPDVGSGPNVVRLHRRWPTIVGAAAAAVLVVLVGVQTVRLDRAQSDLMATERQLAAIQEAVVVGDYAAIRELASTAPGAMTVALSGDAGPASATILPDGSGYLDVHDLAPLDTGSTYQLWAVLDGEVISAAVLGTDDRTVAPFQVDPALLEALVVTSEVAGGVPVSSQPAASAWAADS